MDEPAVNLYLNKQSPAGGRQQEEDAPLHFVPPPEGEAGDLDQIRLDTCTNVINTHLIQHRLFLSLTLVLPHRHFQHPRTATTGSVAKRMIMLNSVKLKCCLSFHQPSPQSYRKHNEAIRFGRSCLEVRRATARVFCCSTPAHDFKAFNNLTRSRLSSSLPQQQVQCSLIGPLSE